MGKLVAQDGAPGVGAGASFTKLVTLLDEGRWSSSCPDSGLEHRPPLAGRGQLQAVLLCPMCRPAAPTGFLCGGCSDPAGQSPVSQVPFLPSRWSLTPERIYFVFEAEQIAPKHMFSKRFPRGEESRPQPHPFSSLPQMTQLKPFVILQEWVLRKRLYRLPPPSEKAVSTRPALPLDVAQVSPRPRALFQT